MLYFVEHQFEQIYFIKIDLSLNINHPLHVTQSLHEFISTVLIKKVEINLLL